MQRLKKYLPYFLIAVILTGLVFSPLTANNSSADIAGTVITTVAGPVVDSIMSTVAYSVLWLVSRVTWIAGAMLDLSVYFSLNMSALLARTTIVTVGWTIFRDLANIFFIFILLYLGIKTIIGLDLESNKKYVTRLIIVALLINFSLFITRVVIDSSNILALQFYKAIRPNYTMDMSNPDFYLDNISSQFMYGLKLSSTYDPKAGEEAGSGGTGFEGGSVVADSATGIVSKKVIVMILGSVLLLVAAFVFFTAAILFTIRTVVLMLLMILSPLAFIGSLLPKTEQYANKWWDQLFNQAFFAPAYLVLTYVVLKSLGSVQTIIAVPADATMSGALGGFALTHVSIIMNYIILIILMLASVVIAKQMGAAGADMATKAGGKMSFGMAGWAGRNTIGRAMSGIANSARFKDIAGKTGLAGRLATRGLSKAASGSFDLRASPLKDFAGNMGASIGSASGKGGFNAARGAAIEKQREFATSLRATGREKEEIEAGKKRATEVVEGQYQQGVAYAANIKQQADIARATGDTARATQLDTAYANSMAASEAARKKGVDTANAIAADAIASRQKAYAEKLEEDNKNMTGLGKLILGGTKREAADKIRGDIKSGFKKDKDLEKAVKDLLAKDDDLKNKITGGGS